MKYETILEQHKGQVFTSEDLSVILGSRQAISSCVSSGMVEKISRGFYGVDVGAGLEYYKIISKYYKNAVICGGTALFLQNLSDYQPEKIDLAVSRESNPSREAEFYKFHRIVETKLVGVETKLIQNEPLKIFTPERCLFEAAKQGPNTEIFSKAMTKYYTLYKYSNFEEISNLGASLPGKEIILSALQSLKESRNIF